MTRTTMSKSKALKLLKRIEQSKAIIAKERDKLRDIHSDLSDVLNTLDEGIYGIEQGVIEIRSGLDEISSYL